MLTKDYFLKPRLCLITDRKLSKRPLIESINEAVSAGVDIIQLREKDLPAKEYFELARQIKIICENHPAIFIINNRVDIALAVDADGVHLGWQSLPFHIVKHLLGKNKIIGISTHSKDEAVSAQEKEADYITLGPVFPTASKDGLIKPLGCNNFIEIKKYLHVPVLAIGGINENNTEEIIKAGADGIAVISAVLQSENISKTIKTMKARLNIN